MPILFFGRRLGATLPAWNIDVRLRIDAVAPFKIDAVDAVALALNSDALTRANIDLVFVFPTGKEQK